MKVKSQSPTVMRCLGGKLETTLADPDPEAFAKLSREYNCRNCENIKLCVKLLRTVEVSL